MPFLSLFRRKSPLVMAAVLSAELLVPDLASAQSAEELAGARAAATEGARAFNEGRFADTVDMMSRAQAIVHSPVHLLFLARSYAKLGQLVKAREHYMKIRREGAPPGASDAIKRTVSEAESELALLEPRIPYVTVTVQGGTGQQVSVSVNGTPIPSVLIGAPYPLDPGKRTFAATAPGKRSDEKTLNISEGTRSSVLLVLVDAPGGAAPNPNSQPPGALQASDGSNTQTMEGSASLTAPGDAGTAGGGNSLRTVSYIAMGVGVVGAGVGTFFLLDGKSKSDKAADVFDKNECADSPLPPTCSFAVRSQIEGLDNDAASANTIGVAGLVVGGVGIAAGVTLFLLSGNESSHAASIKPYIGFRSVGIQGSF